MSVPPVRQRLLTSALALTEAEGWSAVTMAKVARSAGVSRQTVYNEFGTKHGLAQQLTMHEVGRFLQVARDQVLAADDVVTAVRDACEGVLELGRTNVLIRTVAGQWGEDTDHDFLAMLTTESGLIVEVASAVVRDLLVDRFSPLPVDDPTLDVCVDAVIRLVLSHLTRPAKPPAEAADDIAVVVALVLQPVS